MIVKFVINHELIILQSSGVVMLRTVEKGPSPTAVEAATTHE